MEVVLSLASQTVTKILHFSGLLSDDRNVLRSGKMEEKALEVYGEEPIGGGRLTRQHRDGTERIKIGELSQCHLRC